VRPEVAISSVWATLENLKPEEAQRLGLLAAAPALPTTTTEEQPAAATPSPAPEAA
jgi:hypothetical protein